jgi:hypothetical protein
MVQFVPAAKAMSSASWMFEAIVAEGIRGAVSVSRGYVDVGVRV